MRTISVSKYHGAGNDFVMCRESDVLGCGVAPADFAAAVCDRHRGIGADGAILVGGEAAGGEGPIWMHYHNADGSLAPMCGNGIRCLAAYCFDEGICRDVDMPVETLAGTKLVHRLSDDPFTVTVAMGRADWAPASCGITSTDEEVRDVTLTLGDGSKARVWAMFMATDHCVVLCDDAMADANMETGRLICHDPFFTRQINANFAQVVDASTMLVRTYERGCGPTLACGTGVCASVVAAHEAGLVGPSVEVDVPGGHIRIDIDETGMVSMTGGATRIMRGECFL